MPSPPLCPLHGEHPELSCASCDEAAARWQAERLGSHEPSESESDLGNIAFMLRRFTRRQPNVVGSLLGIVWCFVAIGVLQGLRWILPEGFDPMRDFVFQCAVFVLPFIVLLVFIRARSGR
ncbi:MAG: hypothetical protein ACHQPI_11000 [Thermoanaerobaculia bacterium]